MNTQTQEVTKPTPTPPATPSAPVDTRTPRVDVIETPEAYLVTADVPGVPMDAIEVTVEKNRLEVVANRTPASREGYSPALRQFSEGGYRRAFKIPQEIDRQSIRADLRDGVLRVTLPKAQPEKAQKVRIEAGA